MSDGTGLAETLLGLDGFRVLAVTESPEELVINDRDAEMVGCSSCGVRAEAQVTRGAIPQWLPTV